MGKRPYYVIYVIKDCDGYESWLEYVGTNWKAAYARYKNLIETIKQEYFIDEGVDRDDIDCNFTPLDRPLDINRTIYTNVNDNDCCWMSVCMQCLNTGTFLNPGHENRYRQEYPNAKY